MANHIRFRRETVANARRPVTRGFASVRKPANPNAYFAEKRKQLGDLPSLMKSSDGYDSRLLIRLEIDKALIVDQLKDIPGLEFVEQDSQGVVIIFATPEALASFEERMSLLEQGEKVSSASENVIYALKQLSDWTPDDRTGPRLKLGPVPNSKFLVDIELWSQDGNIGEQRKMRSAFEAWLKEKNIELVDSLPGLPYYRVEILPNALKSILNHRDVKRIDFPPSYGVSAENLNTGVEQYEAGVQPPANAPKLAILDTGVASNHPFIANALADAQSYIGGDPQDNHGHGTWVAGIGLYGDVKASADSKTFIPKIWILSGKVLDGNNEYQRKIILNSIQEAVDYFAEQYACKVFNLSFGDAQFPYSGGRLQALAVGLDEISRRMDVLFVISAGNTVLEHLSDKEVYEQYPVYLKEETSKVVDPATAVNAVTVGSLAEYDLAPYADNKKLKYFPCAEKSHPSPFTRSGPSIKGSMKPNFVEFGGNYAFHSEYNKLNYQHLGQLTLNNNFLTDGKLFSQVCGTSFSAPKIANLAARLSGLLPDVSSNTLKAIMAAHATYPLNSKQLESFKGALSLSEQQHISQVFGYGIVDDEWLFSSGDEAVTIYAEDKIKDDENHYYELPLPDEFLSGGKRIRQYSIALAHTPSIRGSRLDYTATRMCFRVKAASSLDQVANIFSDKENVVRMNEDTIGKPANSIGPQLRDRCTLQASRFVFQMDPRKLAQGKKLYLAVVRNDRSWAERNKDVEIAEPYSIAISINDRDALEANLYASVQTKLGNKIVQKAQERIRS